MAIEYFIYSDLDVSDLKERLDGYASGVQGLWQHVSATDELGPFHQEIIQEYGISEPFRTSIYCRHYKDRSIEARAKLLDFFYSLHSRKLVLNGDDFIDYKDA